MIDTVIVGSLFVEVAEAFRARCRDSSPARPSGRSPQPRRRTRFQGKLAEAGLAGLAYPTELGAPDSRSARTALPPVSQELAVWRVSW